MILKLKQVLHYFAAFFIKNEKGYVASFRFSLWTFAFESLVTLYTFYLISSKVRFRGVISLENSLVVAIILFFLLRVFALHFFLGGILRLLEEVFSVRRRKVLYGMVLLYAYLFIAIKYPQNFDEFSGVSWLLKQARLFDFIWILYLPAAGVLVTLWVSLIRNAPKSGLRWSAAFASSFILALFLWRVQELHPKWEDPQGPTNISSKVEIQGERDKKPNIIFITVDSMRGDTPLEEFPEASSELKTYLGKSWRFDRVVSPLAQTHGALTSLFTAQNPTDHGVRTNLAQKGLQSDSLLAGSPLSELKKSGYEVRFIQDVEEYANFNAGNVIDHLQAPDYSVANVIISTFFKNRVIFGLFNNPVGYFFLPELKNNTSFFYSYDLPRYTTEVLKELQRIPESKAPVFLFVHTCSLHWPGVLPHPYYLQEGFPKDSSTPFSYTSKFRGLSYQRLSPKAWRDQAEFNAKIYRSALKMTVEDFLNPVFQKIQALGLDKNSVVVLLSDHGEDFWNKSARFPKEKYVQHGSSLIFGASSELSFLRMHFPDLAEKKINETVGTIDILPTVADYVGSPVVATEGKSLLSKEDGGLHGERLYYTETGLWPLAMFRGQFVTTPATSLGPLFKLNPERMALFIDPKFLPGIIQQKQRAIYFKSYRLTLYPTDYGYQEFLCDREKDFDCQHNLISEKPEVLAKMRISLQAYVDKDVENGLLKVGACSPFAKKSPIAAEFNNIAEYQWQYYFQALECLRSHNDYVYAVNVFNRLLDNEETSTGLKSRIGKTLLNLCALAGAFNDGNLPSFIRHKVEVEIEESDRISFPYTTRACLLTLGRPALAKKLEEKFQLKTADMSPEQLIGLDDEEPEEGSKKEFRGLLKQYALASAQGKAEISERLQDHPKAEYYEKELEIATIYEKAGGDAVLLQSGLDVYFAVERNYQLADYLEKYYFVSAKLRFQKDRNDGLFHILQQLSGNTPFPLSYFNYMLFKIDELTQGDGLSAASSLRFRAWQNETIQGGSFNLRKLETSLALVKGRNYFCREQNSRICLEVKNIVTKTGAEKVVKDMNL